MEITPHTRIGALLDAHPEMLEVLIAAVPAFDKLKNPVLRATVAKFATLEQAAKLGGIPLPDLIRLIQDRLGVAAGEVAMEAPAASLAAGPPAWFRAAAVIARIDVGALLATGGHPLVEARRALASGGAEAIIVMESDFEPAPLLARAGSEGLEAVCYRDQGLYRTVLRRA